MEYDKQINDKPLQVEMNSQATHYKTLKRAFICDRVF